MLEIQYYLFFYFSYHFNVAKKHDWPARSCGISLWWVRFLLPSTATFVSQQSSDLFFIVTVKTSATPTLTEKSWIWCVFEVTCLIMRKKTSSRVWTECLVDLAKKKKKGQAFRKVCLPSPVFVCGQMIICIYLCINNCLPWLKGV